MNSESKECFHDLDDDIKNKIPISFRLATENGEQKNHNFPQLIDGSYYNCKQMIAFRFEKPISKILLLK